MGFLFRGLQSLESALIDQQQDHSDDSDPHQQPDRHGHKEIAEIAHDDLLDKFLKLNCLDAASDCEWSNSYKESTEPHTIQTARKIHPISYRFNCKLLHLGYL